MDHNEGEPIRYYLHQANKMRENERVTMYIDYDHISNFPHEDPEFMPNLVKYFYRYEPNLRAGLVKFIQKTGNDVNKLIKNYYQFAIYNLP